MLRYRALVVLLSMVTTIAAVEAQDLTGLQLIAHYPLTSDSLDATGNNPPITLTNVEFREGGVYCNGVYLYGTEPGGYEVLTPELSGLDFKKFAIQVKFKVDEFRQQPVLIGGMLYRWIGFYLRSDSGMMVVYNDHRDDVADSVRYSLNTFHTLTIVYDSLASRGEWYLDGKLIHAVSFVISHGGDRKIGTTHYGNAEAFKGILSDLRVYSLPGGATGVARGTRGVPADFVLLQNTPNPFNSSTVIRFRLCRPGQVKLSVFDALGREVATLLQGRVGAGKHSVRFDAGQLPSGSYLYVLKSGGVRLSGRMTLVR